MPSSLKLGKTIIPYEERKSPRTKRISIRITPEKVRVSAPVRTSKGEIQAFIEKNQEWILENWLKLQETAVKPLRVYETGEKVSYLGKELNLEIMDTPHKMISAFYRKDLETLEIKMPQELQGEQRQEAVREILEKWYKQKARAVYLQKLNFWSCQMGVTYNQFRLKEQKTRWGSCSSLGNINLNWRAIMAPEPVLDYLVIHELSHLLYLNHSPDFWENVARYCPEHAVHRRWLREKGHSLVI
ncbi:putative metal-dependent hydrolase [Desulfitobacterium dehalogenans ATCC 51507]|uniref:Putative metal-dependent hydrolase n=1 Tax=Desulfitobacterium dehalogenans (strain ATCC 51507 / DSM 9161 / JW/IU-DC1) TaxID=756499 RepID=I4A4F6_DESDJ|nr:SprT family zinc-dependent metalloprotease [Desulfitobacterium dehalogenans]AFL98840.1 putative metal-dependent hydrolase [Desulfitobacterium dehalogenans ATCC 51507]